MRTGTFPSHWGVKLDVVEEETLGGCEAGCSEEGVVVSVWQERLWAATRWVEKQLEKGY